MAVGSTKKDVYINIYFNTKIVWLAILRLAKNKKLIQMPKKKKLFRH
jgi:hypothetical protein